MAKWLLPALTRLSVVVLSQMLSTRASVGPTRGRRCAQAAHPDTREFQAPAFTEIIRLLGFFRKRMRTRKQRETRDLAKIRKGLEALLEALAQSRAWLCPSEAECSSLHPKARRQLCLVWTQAALDLHRVYPELANECASNALYWSEFASHRPVSPDAYLNRAIQLTTRALRSYAGEDEALLHAASQA